MRSSWKGLYLSSDIFFKILRVKKKYGNLMLKKEKPKKLKVFLKKVFRINPRKVGGIRNSTVIPAMESFVFEIPTGAKGLVKVKVRKKGKNMNVLKKSKIIRVKLPMLNHKLGEFGFTRHFVKHTTKTKKK